MIGLSVVEELAITDRLINRRCFRVNIDPLTAPQNDTCATYTYVPARLSVNGAIHVAVNPSTTIAHLASTLTGTLSCTALAEAGISTSAYYGVLMVILVLGAITCSTGMLACIAIGWCQLTQRQTIAQRGGGDAANVFEFDFTMGGHAKQSTSVPSTKQTSPVECDRVRAKNESFFNCEEIQHSVSGGNIYGEVQVHVNELTEEPLEEKKDSSFNVVVNTQNASDEEELYL